MIRCIFTCVLTGVILLSAVACSAGEPQETAPAPAPVPAEREYDFTDVRVIYPASAGDAAQSAAQSVKTQLRSNLLAEVAMEADSSPATAREVLVGDTNRPESAAAKAKLPADQVNAYRIELSGDKFVIVASSDDALVTAARCFINDVVKSIREKKLTLPGNYCYADSYGVAADLLTNGVQIKTQLISTIYGSTPQKLITDLSYGRIVELAHNGAYNGMLIATSEAVNDDHYPVHRSTDFGATWEKVGEVHAQKKDRVANWQPMLFELPCKVGDLEEGTLLLAGCIRNGNTTKTEMVIYKSTDFGSNWSLVSTVDSADGFSTAGGLSKGLWEPFLLTDDDGVLWCFYSDEKEAEVHSQKLVCRHSTDGIHWSETQDVVALEDKNLRPGMITVTRMGNGQYVATYEIVGMANNAIHFKTTDDLTDWNPADKGSPVVTKKGEGFGSAPYCAWIPTGGDCGTLVVAAMFNYDQPDEIAADFLLSFDYGETFVAVKNPLYYETTVEARYAYSPGFFPSADGTKLYYVNTVPSQAPGKQDLKLAVLEIVPYGVLQ